MSSCSPPFLCLSSPLLYMSRWCGFECKSSLGCCTVISSRLHTMQVIFSCDQRADLARRWTEAAVKGEAALGRHGACSRQRHLLACYLPVRQIGISIFAAKYSGLRCNLMHRPTGWGYDMQLRMHWHRQTIAMGRHVCKCMRVS